MRTSSTKGLHCTAKLLPVLASTAILDYDIFCVSTLKREREKWVVETGGSERHYIGWERKIIFFGFEGSQAAPTRPSGRVKQLTDIIEVQFYGVRKRGCV
jgi:hypothetical protein